MVKKESITQEKVVVFDSEFTAKSVTKLISSIVDCGLSNIQSTNLTIYLNTDGGFVSSANTLAHYLLSLIEHGLTLSVIVTEYCNSSGLYFLAHLLQESKKCKGCVNVSFFKYSIGIHHKVALTLHTRKDGKMMEKHLGDISKRTDESLKFFGKHMTKDEISDFKTGGDVCFDTERLAKIFNGKIIEVH